MDRSSYVKNSSLSWYSKMYDSIGELPSDDGSFHVTVTDESVTSTISGTPGALGTSAHGEEKIDDI